MPRFLRIDALALEDPFGLSRSPGSVLLRLDEEAVPFRLHSRDVPWARVRVLSSGSPAEVDSHVDAANAQRLELPEHVVLPGLANAHTHLDLTHIGPRPAEAGFTSFAGLVMRERATEDEAIRESVERGIRLQLEGGVVAVGDIAGNAGGRARISPWRTLRGSGLRGVSFVEFFAIGSRRDRALANLDAFLAEHAAEFAERGPVRLALSPHAPYSVEPAAYEHAITAALAGRFLLMTHLAESVEEREFVAGAGGAFRSFLGSLGLWEARLEGVIGRGLSPVEHLGSVLGRAGAAMSAVHLNDVSDADLDVLAAAGTPVVYCPRASAYFGAPAALGPHRWREMAARGIPVALGTDSIINLPAGAEAAGEGAFSTLGEMRSLWEFARGDAGADPRVILRMATSNAAPVLGMDAREWSLAAGSCPAGIVAVQTEGRGGGTVMSSRPASALAAVFEARSPAELIVIGNTPETPEGGVLRDG